MTDQRTGAGGREALASATALTYSAADFLRHFVVVTTLAVGCIAGANYVINPLGLYAPKVFPPLVRTSRSDKLELIHNFSPKPEAVVLGSSRAMQISPAVVQRLTGLPGFNLAVDSARTEDYYALVRRLVEGEGARPRLLLIGVDVEAFHDHVAPDDRLLALPALTTYLNGNDRRSATAMKLRQIVAQQQTLLSARAGAPAPQRGLASVPQERERRLLTLRTRWLPSVRRLGTATRSWPASP